jgi:hypothetical protein
MDQIDLFNDLPWMVSVHHRTSPKVYFIFVSQQYLYTIFKDVDGAMRIDWQYHHPVDGSFNVNQYCFTNMTISTPYTKQLNMLKDCSLTTI